jgi:putative aldouronate transport system substrate-binding protein
MFRKIVSLFVLMGVLLAGCSPAATPTEQPAAVEPTAAQAAAEPTKEAAAEPTKETVAEPTKETVAEPTAEPAPAEVVTLDYYWVGNADTDQRPLVEAAINEYIEPLIGANVVFHIIGWGDWASKAVTGMQSGEKIDIIFTADWFYYMQYVSEGLLRPLNDDNGEYGNLLNEYGQDIVSSLNPSFITGTQIDGVNYAVPTNKELTVPEGFIYNVTWAEEIGMTPEEIAKINTVQDLEPWLAKAKAAHPDEYPYLTDGRVGFNPWVPDFVGNLSGLIDMKMAPGADGKFDETIVSVMESDWAKEYTALMRDWYQKGYIHPDTGLTTFAAADFLNAGKFLVQPTPLKGNNIKAQELVNSSGNADLKLGEIYSANLPKINITVHSGGSMLGIPMISEHPVEAMKFINLMHSDSKLLNMMLFGVEGTHWKLDPDGRVNIVDSAWYGAIPGAWTVGDITLQSVSNKEDPNKAKLLIDYSNDAISHASLGFRFRTEPVAAEITAIQAVVDGMHRALMTGYVDPAVELPKYIADLKAAGLDKVLAEVQKQYDAWKAAKGE